MVDLHTDEIPWRGIAVGGVVLFAGSLTALLVDDPILPALMAAVVLLVLLVVDDRTREDE